MNNGSADSKYLAGKTVEAGTLAGWVEQFHRDGFLVVNNVLSAEQIAALKDDLDRAIEADVGAPGGGAYAGKSLGLHIQERLFERSRANLELFDLEPIVSFAETLIGESTHVFHNNSFRTYPGGGISAWHMDDRPHYLVTHGERPTNVRLPVMFFTCNYYLTDVETVEHGPTEVIPGSHLFGALPPKSERAVHGAPDAMAGTPYEKLIHPCLGLAGSVVMFNNQVWHRGAPNLTERTRYITQVSYGRRIVGHMYYPFMNYVMPEHVYKDADARRKRLLGFLPHGPYG